jgi:hypothetical protein
LPRIRITNRENSEVRILGKFSNGGIPFDELPYAPEFPRLLQKGEVFEFETDGSSEFLYRRDQRIGASAKEPTIIVHLYRVKIGQDAELIKAYVWPLPVMPMELPQ